MATPVRVALLTGGQDKSYALGMVEALTGRGIGVDYVGSDAVEDPRLHGNPLVRVLNLRGSQDEQQPLTVKVRRLLRFYARLVSYIVRESPPLVHVLWHDKFEYVSRSLGMAFYRLCGKCVVMTAHNVNTARRDGHDSWLNRLTLKVQYTLASLIVVHTQAMRDELKRDFGVMEERILVVPFGLNDTTPRTGMSPEDARSRLGLDREEPLLLLFGQIAPYKGVIDLVRALPTVRSRVGPVRVLIAGKVKRGHEDYWTAVRAEIAALGDAFIIHDRFIPDEDVEVYFMAADAVVLPYREIYQSGVPFLAYGFGTPVVATRVGALPEDVREGTTGFLADPARPESLADAIERFFDSTLYRCRGAHRAEIRAWAAAEHSWSAVGERLAESYWRLALRNVPPDARAVWQRRDQ